MDTERKNQSTQFEKYTELHAPWIGDRLLKNEHRILPGGM